MLPRISDVCQHQREQDRQQLLEQVAIAGASLGQRRCDLVGVVASEERRDRLLPVALANLVDTPTGVEQASGGVTTCGGLNLAGVLGILRVVLQSAQQHRYQRMNRAIDFAFVGAELACDIRSGNLSVKIVKTGHRRVSTFVAGM
jgi:hypothetical protein